jgi:enamine deaminase RidA (YjgF/YER057c/UK114 family)
MTKKTTDTNINKQFKEKKKKKPPLMQVPAGLSFVTVRRSAGLIWLAGHGPSLHKRPPEFDYVGKVGRELTKEQGYAAARLVGLNLLVSLRAALGLLDHVETVLQVIGAVNSAEDFDQQSFVLNGCTDLLVEVFQDAGRPTRMAFGPYMLPFNMAVEASMVIAVREN